MPLLRPEFFANSMHWPFLRHERRLNLLNRMGEAKCSQRFLWKRGAKPIVRCGVQTGRANPRFAEVETLQ